MKRESYSKAYKMKAVELSNVRGNVVEIARELGIDSGLIYRWRRELDRNPEIAFSGKGVKALTEEEKELEHLRKKLKDVELENEILKKAVGIFSKRDRKS